MGKRKKKRQNIDFWHKKRLNEKKRVRIIFNIIT